MVLKRKIDILISDLVDKAQAATLAADHEGSDPEPRQEAEAELTAARLALEQFLRRFPNNCSFRKPRKK